MNILIGSSNKQELWQELTKQEFGVHPAVKEVIDDPRFAIGEKKVVQVEYMWTRGIPRSPENYTPEPLQKRFYWEACDNMPRRKLRLCTPEEAVRFFIQGVPNDHPEIHKSRYFVVAQSFDDMPLIFMLVDRSRLTYPKGETFLQGKQLLVRRFDYPDEAYGNCFYVFAKP